MSHPDQAMQAMMQDPNQVPGGDPNGAANNYYPQDPDLTGGLPINLDSLRDGPPGSKPFYPYSTLIRSVPLSYKGLGAVMLTLSSSLDTLSRVHLMANYS